MPRTASTATRSPAGTAGLAPPGEWGRAAGCAAAGLDPVLREVFTTDTSTPFDGEAVRVCRSCPVRAACTAYAATIHPESGIWGGWRRVDSATARRLRIPTPHHRGPVSRTG